MRLWVSSIPQAMSVCSETLEVSDSLDLKVIDHHWHFLLCLSLNFLRFSSASELTSSDELLQ